MDSSFSLLICGDIRINKEVKDDWLSEEFYQIIKRHDIVSCNFEAPIRGRGKPISKAGVHLDQWEGAPKFLERAGFNLINLANNHIFDFGNEGLKKTIESFSKAKVVGAGQNFFEAYHLQVFYMRGIKIGFLSFCEAEFGALIDEKEDRGGYAWINHPKVNQLIQESKKTVHVLIVQVHAGVEQINIPLPEWRERYKELIDLGADVVIGHHPHVPQGWEFYSGRPIFYSLGNFFFDMKSSHPQWNKGIALSISFAGSQIRSYKVIPIIKDNRKLKILQDMQFEKHLKRINEMLLDDSYMSHVEKLVKDLWKDRYKYYYLSATNGIDSERFYTNVFRLLFRKLVGKGSEINSSLLLHNLRIESHRYTVVRYLSMKVENDV